MEELVSKLSPEECYELCWWLYLRLKSLGFRARRFNYECRKKCRERGYPVYPTQHLVVEHLRRMAT